MKTVQIALRNFEYGEALRHLLLRDGAHRVYVVDRPDLKLDGVIVIDSDQVESLCFVDREPERFVVITHKGSDHLGAIWEAGVRHVVFEGDSPGTTHLAIAAAELRLPRTAARTGAPAQSGACLERHRNMLYPELPTIDSPPRCAKCQHQRQTIRF
jgi:hypothetical protein